MTETRIKCSPSCKADCLRLNPCFFCVTAVWPKRQPAFDLVITNGHIIDGTGSPWYSGDVGIRDGKIAAIGNLIDAPRKRTIDAAGKVVAPGFIDMLGQSEMTILVDPRLPSKIYQGITTEITGEGNSIAPLNDAIINRTDRLRSLSRSIRIGALFANTSHGSKSRAWESTSPAMLARRRSGAWCSETTTSSPRPNNSNR